MLKKCISMLLILMLILGFGVCQAAAYKGPADTGSLDPNNKCQIQPTIYSSPRYLVTATGKAFDLNSGLSAAKINSNDDSRSYGLYFKFTPKGGGYHISRFDVVVTNADGEALYVDGFDSDMDCERGYYWAWNFFPLEGLFYNMNILYGEVLTGKYTMDIYFNGLWAGKTTFSIKK